MIIPPETAAVIPAYNESERIGRVVREVRKYADKVIVVDDASTDETSEIAADNGAETIILEKNRGVGFATRAGCDRALKIGAGYIITIDADGQHEPSEIPLLLNELRSKNLDIVFGSRKRNDEMPLIKRIGNAALASLFFLLYKTRIEDTQTGFHAFRREAYKMLRWISDGYALATEMSVRVVEYKMKFTEVRVSTIYYGKKKGMMIRDGLKAVCLMLFWKFKCL